MHSTYEPIPQIFFVEFLDVLAFNHFVRPKKVIFLRYKKFFYFEWREKIKAFFLSTLLIISSGFTEEVVLDSSYFFPQIYENLWPDFCWEHLRRFPNECSEQHTDQSGNFYQDYLIGGISACQIDKALISRCHPYSSLIPTRSKKCSFLYCTSCHLPVKHGCFIIGNKMGEEDGEWVAVFNKCNCLKNWYHEEDEEEENEDNSREFIRHNWKYCSNFSIPSIYFDFHNKQFFNLLEEHLRFCKENKECFCYWPYRSKLACKISDHVYENIYKLIDTHYNQLNWETFFSLRYPQLENRTIYGVVLGLFSHAFFYSHYREVLLNLASSENWYVEELSQSINIIDFIYSLIDKLQEDFLTLYSECLTQHPHPKIFYERGMILFHQGMMLDSLQDIRELINQAIQNNQGDLLTSELYFKEGSIYAELNLYDKAIESLTQAIQKDPENKDAYFERAVCFFELGDFDKSLADYLNSNESPKKSSVASEAMYFSIGLIGGLAEGALDATVDFIPSLMGSLHGLGNCLWTFANHPITVSNEFVQATQACIQFIKNNTPKDMLKQLTPELRNLVENWESLDEMKRGKVIGHVIGKYGVDIFCGMGIAKGMRAYRNLKKANNLLTLEAMAINESNREIIKLEALKRAKIRKEMLRSSNIKIKPDLQGKHIIGHKNYIEGKSIVEHRNLQELVNQYAGSGIKARSDSFLPGQAGYQEIVNFKEFIGYYIERETGKKAPTNWGKIHYAKDGVHVVPTAPRS